MNSHVFFQIVFNIGENAVNNKSDVNRNETGNIAISFDLCIYAEIHKKLQ
jgi:hypothetical protein